MRKLRSLDTGRLCVFLDPGGGGVGGVEGCGGGCGGGGSDLLCYTRESVLPRAQMHLNSGGRTPGSLTPDVTATPSPPRWRGSALAVCLCTRP